MAYIGSSAAPIPVNFSAVQSQGFNGTGSQTAFTMTRSVATPSAIEVLVNNVQQSPFDGSYTVSDTTLTFSEAPSAGTNNVYVVYRDQPVGSLIDTGAVRKSGDTITGQLIVEGSNGAVTVRGASTGAQLKLERTASSQGHGYLGADADYALRVYNSAFADGLRVDQSGRVTMPYQPRFLAFGIGAFVSYGSNSTYNLTGLQVNIGSGFNTSTSRFTAPISGFYVFNYGLYVNSTVQTALKLNGVDFVPSGGGDNLGLLTTSANEVSSASIALQLNAGDYVSIGTRNGQSTGVYHGHLWFSGYLIG